MVSKDNVYLPAATDEILKGHVSGDAHPRYVVNADGDLEWGSGSGATDTNLYRSAADTLKTDDAFVAGDTLTATAGLIETVTAASTAANISNNGITTLGSTAAKTYTLDAPVSGVVKKLICTAATTTIQTVNSGSTGITFDGSNDNLTFNAANEAVILQGLSATRWAVISNVNAVGIS